MRPALVVLRTCISRIPPRPTYSPFAIRVSNRHLMVSSIQKRTMAAASSSSSQGPQDPSPTSYPPPSAEEDTGTGTGTGTGTSSSTPLPLPEPPKDGATITLDVNSSEGVKLDHLGPLVVNTDGTMSRINNWAEMSSVERENTLRVLGKRNQARLKKLREAKGE
jgi:hypothetical protein